VIPRMLPSVEYSISVSINPVTRRSGGSRFPSS
jgi:hypothetical protein